MNIDIIKNYTSSIKSLIQNNNINELLLTIKKYKNLSKLLLPDEKNDIVIQILSNDNIVKKDKIFVIKKLLLFKININCFNQYKQYPLHIICLKNIYELIPIFINQKNNKDIYGKCPFEYIFENVFLFKDSCDLLNKNNQTITFDNLLFESFNNIDYAISFSNIFKNYDILKNNCIEIYSNIQNVIDKKSIIIEENQWNSFETNEFIHDEWENIEKSFWKNVIENINQNKLYDKSKFKIPDQNIILLNKIRESILLGYLQYSIKTYNNLTNINYNDINNIINKYDKLLTHKKAVFPRNNIINFENNYFIKGHNLLIIIPMPNYIGDLSYNSLITNYNYYNYKNWVILKLFIRYNKNTERIIEHFHRVFQQFKNILSNSSKLNWKELYWLLVSLPYNEKNSYVSDNVKNFDTKFMKYLYKIKDIKNNENYKMFEYDYFKSINSMDLNEENSYLNLYKKKYCQIKKTILHNYLKTNNSIELKYLQISFGFEMIILFKCLENNEYDKSLYEFPLNSEYDEDIMKRYYTHKNDEHFTKVYSYKNNINEKRIKSSAMNMNQLLISYKTDPMNFLNNEIFQKEEILDTFLNNKEYKLQHYEWNDNTYEDIFVDFIMSKIKFLCTLQYEEVNIEKLYYSKLNDTTIIFENLFNNLDNILNINNNNYSIEEKINLINKIILPDNHLYSFIIKFIKIEKKLNSKINTYILIVLLLISNLWNLSNSFKQFYFPEKNFNNSILKKLYTQIEIFYNENYRSKTNVNFFTDSNLKDFTDILKTKGIKNLITLLSEKNDKYKLIYYILINLQSFINIFMNINNGFFLLNIITSIYGNIIDCYLDKNQMFKFNVMDISKKLQIDLDLIEKLNSTEIITLSDILPVYLYIVFNPNIIIDILLENKNVLEIINHQYKSDITLNDIKIFSGLITELKTLLFHSSNIYYINGTFLNIMTYSCAASMKLCTLFFDDDDNVKENKDISKKYFKLLSKYESILHQHEFMLMFNSENIDLHLFLNHISNLNMEDCHIISVLMKIYGVHPKRQKIINEIFDAKNFLIETKNNSFSLDQIIIQQIFYGVFLSECIDLHYIYDTYTFYDNSYNYSFLTNIYGKNFHSKEFVIDKVLDTYSKYSNNEKENKLHPFLDISNIYNTDKKISDIYLSLNDKTLNIGMSQTGQYIVYIDFYGRIKVSHNYGLTFSDSNVVFIDSYKYNIKFNDNGSVIHFFNFDGNLSKKYIENYGFGENLIDDIDEKKTFTINFRSFYNNPEKMIDKEYIRIFLSNMIKNYYKHIFLDIFEIMYQIFDKIKLQIKNNKDNIFLSTNNNIFNLDINNKTYLVPNNGEKIEFSRGKKNFRKYINLESNEIIDLEIGEDGKPINYYDDEVVVPLLKNDDYDFDKIFNHPFLEKDDNNFKSTENNINNFQYQHIFTYHLKSYIDMLINDIENDTDTFLEYISKGIKRTEDMNNKKSYYEFILLSYYDLLSFLLNYEKNEIKFENDFSTDDFSTENEQNLHKYTIFSSHKYLKNNDYIVEKDCIINKNHLSNILQKLKNETFSNDKILTSLNFYNLNNRFKEDIIDRYKNIIFKDINLNNFKFKNETYLYNVNNNIEVGVRLSKSDNRFNVYNLEIKEKNRIYTYLLQIFVQYNSNELDLDNDQNSIQKYEKEIIYLSYIDNEKINDINFSFNSQQIIISTTSTIATSYDYGKKWDIDFLLHYEFLCNNSKYSTKNIKNKIYSANINSHSNYQYIIARINGEHKILIRNGYNKKIYNEETELINKKFKFFSNIDNIKNYDYHEINIPNKLNYKFNNSENKINQIKIVSNFYHNRIIFKFYDSIEFYYDHQFFYKEKIFYNSRKMEDDIYIVLKENPDIKDYIIGSRIDVPIICIYNKIQNLLIKIDDFSHQFYNELKKNFPEQQNNFIYLYTFYIEEIIFIMEEINSLMKIIDKEKLQYDLKVNKILKFILNNNIIKTNLSFNDFKGLINRTIETNNIQTDIIDKKIYDDYLNKLNTHLGIFNLYHYINDKNYYISRDLIKSKNIIRSFHSFKSTIEKFSPIDIIDENDVFISYIKEKSIYNFLHQLKNINTKEYQNYYKQINPKINEYLKYFIQNKLFDVIVYNNRFFLKNNSSILNEKKKIISFEKFMNNQNNNNDINDDKIFILLPINNFNTNDKWLIFQDLYYLDNNLLKKFINNFYKFDKNIIKQIIPFIIDISNNYLYNYILYKFNILGYDYNFIIKKKINELEYFKKEMISHFQINLQDKFKKEYNLEEIYLDNYYNDILNIYNKKIRNNSIYLQDYNIEIILNTPLKIFSDYNITTNDEYNLKLYNLFNYKLNENDIDTIEFQNYFVQQLNNNKIYFILLNYLNDIRNIINNFCIIDINLYRLKLMIIYNREQNIKNSI